jgi:hypothetical protein
LWPLLRSATRGAEESENPIFYVFAFFFPPKNEEKILSPRETLSSSLASTTTRRADTLPKSPANFRDLKTTDERTNFNPSSACFTRSDEPSVLLFP